MEEDQIDKLFRKNLVNCEDLPKHIHWNKDQSWTHFEKKLPKPSFYKLTWFKVAVAASIIFISFLGGWYFQLLYQGKAQFSHEANRAIKEIELPGGHHCTLAPYSKVLFTHATGLMMPDTLFVDGEAYLETSPRKKLVVIAKNSLSVCSNAILNIKATIEDKNVVISSIAGKIITRCTENQFPDQTILPDEQYSILEGGLVAFKAKNSDPNFLAWKTGILKFDNVPLEYAIKIMENYYGVCIDFEKEEHKYCPLNTQWNNLSLNEAFSKLESHFHLKVKHKGLMYLLSGEGC